MSYDRNRLMPRIPSQNRHDAYAVQTRLFLEEEGMWARRFLSGRDAVEHRRAAATLQRRARLDQNATPLRIIPG